MFNFTKEFSFVFLEFLDIHSFVTLSCLNKEYLDDIRHYFKAKKALYNRYNIKKTLNNSLLKMPLYKAKNWRRDELCGMMAIVKVIKSSHNICDERAMDKLKIYYWMISHPGKIGHKYVIYPNWCFIRQESITDKTLIPFR
jgi:hypothetical protein